MEIKQYKPQTKEIKKLNDRVTFRPIHPHQLTELEKKGAIECLMFLVQKRDDYIKARTCAVGTPQRQYIERNKIASPTASTDGIFITGVIAAR